jgi:hypothetical protein
MMMLRLFSTALIISPVAMMQEVEVTASGKISDAFLCSGEILFFFLEPPSVEN